MALRFLCVFGFFSATLGQGFNIGLPWEQIGAIQEHNPPCDISILPSIMMEVNEGENAILYCKAECGDVPLTMQWENNNGQQVPVGSGGVRLWLGLLRYDLELVRPENEGNYICKGYFAGNWLIRTAYLKIRPRFSSTTTTTTTTSTTTTTNAPSTTSSATTQTTSQSTLTTTTALSATTSSTTDEATTIISIAQSSTVLNSPSEELSVSTAVDQVMPSEEPSLTSPEDNSISELSTDVLTTVDDPSAASSLASSAMPPNASSSETSSSDISQQNSSSFDTLQPSVIPQTSAGDSTLESQSSEISSIISSDVSSAVTEAQPSVVYVKIVPRNVTARGEINLGENIQTEIIQGNSENTNNDFVNIIPDFISHRRKRDSPTRPKQGYKANAIALQSKNGTDISAVNKTWLYGDAIFDTCSGFGPSAIATIAILGALCLILLYAFILALCLPRVRRRKTVEISEKEMEEGGGEGIEIKEKPENNPAGPNGRISHGEEAVTTVDINDTEKNEENMAAASSGDNNPNETFADAVVEKPSTSEKQEEETKVVPEDDLKHDGNENPPKLEESGEIPLLPPPTPPTSYSDQETKAEETEQARSTFEESREENVDPVHPSPITNEEEKSPQQHVPVFDDPEPQEMIVKQSFVDDVNVELEDKSVDTVELESQDIEEPVDNMTDMNHDVYEPEPEQSPSSAPVFEREEFSSVKSNAPAEERLSNGFDTPEPNEHNNLAPEKDEMTKSIEDLPPPPPIPAHCPPPPPPPVGADDTLGGLEAPDVVSSSVTAV